MAENDSVTQTGQSIGTSREDYLDSLDSDGTEVGLTDVTSQTGQNNQPIDNSGIGSAGLVLENETKPDEVDTLQNWTIDDRYKDLPPAEGALRTIQSDRDSIFTKNKSMEAQMTENSKALEVLDNLLTDDEYLETFVKERRPDLIQEADRSQVIKEKLNNEFPEFSEEKPVRDDADRDPGGKAWMYYRRLDELWNETGKEGKKYGSLKELQEQRGLKVQEAQAEAEREVDLAKESMKYDDQQVGVFKTWAEKLSVLDLMKIHKAVLTGQGTRSTSLSSAQGAATNPTARQEFLKRL